MKLKLKSLDLYFIYTKIAMFLNFLFAGMEIVTGQLFQAKQCLANRPAGKRSDLMDQRELLNPLNPKRAQRQHFADACFLVCVRPPRAITEREEHFSRNTCDRALRNEVRWPCGQLISSRRENARPESEESR